MRIAVGLDLGSSYTRCVVCAVEHQTLRFMGAGSVPSLGWHRGRVSDVEALSESVRGAVREAEKQSGVTVETVVLGLGGTAIEGVNSRGLYEFGRPREIVTGDLAYAVELAAKLPLGGDRMLLQLFPQDFTVDGRAGYRNPRGLVSSRLEANVHLITTANYDHQALVAAVHRAHLGVEETVFEGIAAAYASLRPEDRAGGVALIDIGLQSTDMVVYDGDALVIASSIPVAGYHLTSDVAHALGITSEDAERIKLEYGCAILGLTSDNSLVEVPSHEDRPARETSRRFVNNILEARAEELFEYAQKELVKVGMHQALREGVVLTGGGALLNGMCDIAEKTLNAPCRNALPIGIAGWPEGLTDTTWTTAAGLAMYGARLGIRRDARRNGFNPFTR